ncbi:MAG TPA: hypothetical protein VFK79_15950, partial [Xanthobacteraceae bacterium]|nr:hypothetical protein [Xanthobacteraceae bacterium]
MRYSRFVMTILMLAIFSVMVAVASRYPAGARFMVFVVGFPAIALCLLQLVLDLREFRNETARAAVGGMPAAAPDTPGVPADVSLQMQMNADGLAVDSYSPETVRKELIVWGYIFALIGSILFFGFYITVPIFLVVFLHFYAQASWRMTILLPAAVCAFLYVLLGYVFRMTLHIGFVTEYLL